MFLGWLTFGSGRGPVPRLAGVGSVFLRNSTQCGKPAMLYIIKELFNLTLFCVCANIEKWSQTLRVQVRKYFVSVVDH